jgi:DNA-binding Xre family transcriptional regulator
MKGRAIIKEIMETKSITNADMAGRLDITQASLWDRLNTKKAKDIPLSTLSEMLRVLDYKVVIVPRNSRVPEGG